LDCTTDRRNLHHLEEKTHRKVSDFLAALLPLHPDGFDLIVTQTVTRGLLGRELMQMKLCHWLSLCLLTNRWEQRVPSGSASQPPLAPALLAEESRPSPLILTGEKELCQAHNLIHTPLQAVICNWEVAAVASEEKAFSKMLYNQTSQKWLKLSRMVPTNRRCFDSQRLSGTHQRCTFSYAIPCT